MHKSSILFEDPTDFVNRLFKLHTEFKICAKRISNSKILIWESIRNNCTNDNSSSIIYGIYSNSRKILLQHFWKSPNSVLISFRFLSSQNFKNSFGFKISNVFKKEFKLIWSQKLYFYLNLVSTMAVLQIRSVLLVSIFGNFNKEADFWILFQTCKDINKLKNDPSRIKIKNV